MNGRPIRGIGMNPGNNASYRANGRRLRRDRTRSPQLLDSNPEKFCQPRLHVLTDWSLTAQYPADEREAYANPVSDLLEREGARPLPRNLDSVRNSFRHTGNLTRGVSIVKTSIPSEKPEKARASLLPGPCRMSTGHDRQSGDGP